jgi:hypothetical protein
VERFERELPAVTIELILKHFHRMQLGWQAMLSLSSHLAQRQIDDCVGSPDPSISSSFGNYLVVLEQQ